VHKKFADQYLGMKNIHPTVKERKCDHVSPTARVGSEGSSSRKRGKSMPAVPQQEKIGLNRKNVHTVLQAGQVYVLPHPTPRRPAIS